ncbi:unnamed protein product [Periconia digitata]|uniref:Phytanoyl-CoA dioxygenase n=1 Tax=Periconia digitata TaxID=1303443 RepID=A0A9W4UTD8_9PLEO|nr:unnamed protein product [Periconia digitata]
MTPPSAAQCIRTTAKRVRASQLITTKCIPGIIHTRYFSRLPCSTPAPELNTHLKNDGCIVLTQMFPPSQISLLNTDFHQALATTTPGRPANPNKAPLPNSLDAQTFGKNTKRIGNLINLSPAFRDHVITNPTLHDLCSEIFKETGDYWLSTAQMIELGPGSKAQPLHADGAGWWPFWTMADTEKEGVLWRPEYAVNFLIAMTDTTVDNGATGVVRGSHKIRYTPDVLNNPDFDAWKFPDDRVEQVELAAGDCLLLGSRIVHRGEENKTVGEKRGLLSCTVVSASLTPDEAFPLVMEAEAREAVKGLDERAKKFVGLRDMNMAIGEGVWQDFRIGGLKTCLVI